MHAKAIRATKDTGRVTARLARLVEVSLATEDLSLSQYRTLILLAEGSAVASALADRLAVTRPSVTAVVDGLVARGLVERRAEPGDRRRVTHVLTEEGRRVLACADHAADARIAELACYLQPEETTSTIASLRRWNGALDALRAEKMGQR